MWAFEIFASSMAASSRLLASDRAWGDCPTEALIFCRISSISSYMKPLTWVLILVVPLALFANGKEPTGEISDRAAFAKRPSFLVFMRLGLKIPDGAAQCWRPHRAQAVGGVSFL